MKKDESCKKYNRNFLHTTKGGALVFGSLGALASGVVIATSLNSPESLEHTVRAAVLVIPITITAGAIVGYVDEKVLGPAYNYICKFTCKDE